MDVLAELKALVSEFTGSYFLGRILLCVRGIELKKYVNLAECNFRL